MAALVFGVCALLTFFAPLLSPTFALLAFGFAIRSFTRRRRRVLAVLGVLSSAAAVALQIWLYRFGHLP